jgi:hypothetical protein
MGTPFRDAVSGKSIKARTGNAVLDGAIYALNHLEAPLPIPTGAEPFNSFEGIARALGFTEEDMHPIDPNAVR